MTTQFNSLVQAMTRQLAGRTLDAELEQWLNANHGAGTPWFDSMQRACTTGIEEGWMCKHEAGGIRYGRVIKPGPDTDGFSIDVVDMQDIAGPHHAHPTGEIDLVMPLTPDARFDGTPAGWKVYPPGSAHRPTVSQGRALVMYFLPEGRIEFSRA